MHWWTGGRKVIDGEDINIKKESGKAEFVHKCCDCGLKHDVEVENHKRHITIRFWKK